MIDAILIYPKLGSLDSVVKDLPLSILYAAAESVKRGYNLKLLDARCHPEKWQETLDAWLAEGVRLVGVSVMTGQPLVNAMEVARHVKRVSPQTRTVWGGPHVTILPGTLDEADFLDFLVRGYGSVCLAELIAKLREDNPDFTDVAGLSFRQDGKVVHNQRSRFHEVVRHTDIPYELLQVTSPCYKRSYSGELMFSLFSSIGCPYQCAFCVHPSIYREINPPKWMPLPIEDVLEHIEFAVREYGISNICFIDDTSFPDLKRMRRLFELIIERGLSVKIEFRGARINELDQMDDEYLRLMVRAGVRVLKAGAESASDRMLKLMRKGITQEQILRVNQKMREHPELIVDYNFFCGAPGESYEDLLETKNVVLRLLRDNPNAYYSFGSDWKPIPGSWMLEYAEKRYGYKPPQTLAQWADMDSFDSSKKIKHPWYTKKHDNLIKMMQLAAFTIDNKISQETSANKSLAYAMLRVLSLLYKPVSWFRLKYDIYDFMLEYDAYRLMVALFPKIVKFFSKSDNEQNN